ncbi:MAG: ASCH domain-containing protein [Alphaproteobacteria bacterium]
MDKAISVNQPWAWAIVNGHKDIENRDWQTKRRGTILIHAGKKFDKDGYRFIQSQFPEIKLPLIEEFKSNMMGGIVGSVEITDCVDKSDSTWFFGKYGFVLENAQSCTLRVCKGALSFFKPDYNSRYKE